MPPENTDPLLPGGAPAPVTPPAVSSGTPPPPPVLPVDDPDKGTPIQLSNEQLTQRLERARTAERTKILKDLGYDSPEAARTALAAAETARQAQLTKEQRLEEENASLRQRATEAEAARVEAMFVSTLTRICAERGIRDFDYARYLVERAASGQDGFDAGAFLDQELQNPQRCAALGFERPPVVVPTNVTTTPAHPNLAPPKPAPTNGAPPVDVMAMNPTEFRQHVQKHYG